MSRREEEACSAVHSSDLAMAISTWTAESRSAHSGGSGDACENCANAPIDIGAAAGSGASAAGSRRRAVLLVLASSR